MSAKCVAPMPMGLSTVLSLLAMVLSLLCVSNFCALENSLIGWRDPEYG